MTFKEVQELIRMVSKSDLSLFKIKDKEFELTIRTDKYSGPMVHHASMPAQAPMMLNPVSYNSTPSAAIPSNTPSVAEPDQPSEKKLIEIKSPMVGTFYRSPGPDKGPFVKIGDRVEQGATVCVIEAMKLFNEIESEISGTIVKVMVEDSAPVEYDQVMFLLEP
ncbi:MAG: acetyl-CoA carboxylase biotin carboxyl carrier protein [Saprospiraceae bacterium]